MVKLSSMLTPRPSLVVGVRVETSNVRTYYVKLPEDVNLPKPGQFDLLYIHGVGEVPISVSDIYYDKRIVAHTVRFVGSVTKTFAYIREGDIIGFRGPYGNGWPLYLCEGKDLVIIAGGIGLPPLRPVIREVARNRAKYNKLIIVYGARNPKELIYRYEYVDYESIPNTELYLTVDAPDETWRGNVGVVTALLPKINLRPDNSIAFICGPEIMMKYAVKELLNMGFKGNQIFLSLERRMRCGVGLCGHCQMGPYFICKHGPVFPFWFIGRYFWVDQI